MTNLRNRMTSRNRKWENAPLWTSKAARRRWNQEQARLARAHQERTDRLHRAEAARLLRLLYKRLPEHKTKEVSKQIGQSSPKTLWTLLVLMASLSSALRRFRRDGLTWPQMESYLQTHQTDSALVLRAVKHCERAARLTHRLVRAGVQARGEA